MRADKQMAVRASTAASTRRHPDIAPPRFPLLRRALKPALAASRLSDIDNGERRADRLAGRVQRTLQIPARFGETAGSGAVGRPSGRP